VIFQSERIKLLRRGWIKDEEDTAADPTIGRHDPPRRAATGTGSRAVECQRRPGDVTVETDCDQLFASQRRWRRPNY